MLHIKIRNRVKALLQQFDGYVDEHIDTALKITAGLKSGLSSPVADIITGIIPGNIDDKLRGKILEGLNAVVDALEITGSCRQQADTGERLACFIRQLQQKSPHLQNALLQKIASLLAAHLDNHRLKQNLYDLYTQAKYTSKMITGS